MMMEDANIDGFSVNQFAQELERNLMEEQEVDDYDDGVSSDEEMDSSLSDEDLIGFERLSLKSKCTFGSDDLPPTLVIKKNDITYCFTLQEARHIAKTRVLPYANTYLLPDELLDVQKFISINA